MKIWNGYGSEHSMNLVMVGRFKKITDAKHAGEIIARFVAQVAEEKTAFREFHPFSERRFSEEMRKLMDDCNLMTIAPEELEQFLLDFHTEVNGQEVVVWTNEIEVSAILKLLLNQGAKVEVYSRHDYPEDSEETGENTPE